MKAVHREMDDLEHLVIFGGAIFWAVVAAIFDAFDYERLAAMSLLVAVLGPICIHIAWRKEIRVMKYVLWFLAFTFWHEETRYFGYNDLAQSLPELAADGFSCLLFAFAAFASIGKPDKPPLTITITKTRVWGDGE